MSTLAIKKTESISDELERMHDRITKRAFAIFDSNGQSFGRDLDDWLAAEKELIWKPPVELTEKDGAFSLCIAVPGVEPKDIHVEVTTEHLLLRAQSRHEHGKDRGEVHVCEFESRNVFRSIRFPKPINPDKVNAEFKNGMLYVNAVLAADAQIQKIELMAS
jgi:HSP20 family molecular chaperone IbpA